MKTDPYELTKHIFGKVKTQQANTPDQLLLIVLMKPHSVVLSFLTALISVKFAHLNRDAAFIYQAF